MTDTTTANAQPTTNPTNPAQGQPIPEEDWISKELESMSREGSIDRLPYMKFEENKIEEITVDFSKVWMEFNGNDPQGNPMKKKIIPVLHNGEAKNWWLNIQNPSLRMLLEEGKKGNRTFRIMKTGKAKDTKYVFTK